MKKTTNSLCFMIAVMTLAGCLTFFVSGCKPQEPASAGGRPARSGNRRRFPRLCGRPSFRDGSFRRRRDPGAGTRSRGPRPTPAGPGGRLGGHGKVRRRVPASLGRLGRLLVRSAGRPILHRGEGADRPDPDGPPVFRGTSCREDSGRGAWWSANPRERNPP